MLSCKKDQYLITTDKTQLQRDRIHRFLCHEAYWCRGIPRAVVDHAIENSLCFGLFDKDQQIGFARVVTDSATFAWICDVYIEREHQGQGLGHWLMSTVINTPQLQGLRRICLATRDAHGLYTPFGFQVTQTPEFWMEIKDNEIYTRLNLDGTR